MTDFRQAGDDISPGEPFQGSILAMTRVAAYGAQWLSAVVSAIPSHKILELEPDAESHKSDTAYLLFCESRCKI